MAEYGSFPESLFSMNVRGPVSISEIVAATGLSRATVDRVLNKRPGVHPRTQAHVLRTLAHLESDGHAGASTALASDLRKTYRFKIIVQAGETFTRSMLERVRKLREADGGGGATCRRRNLGNAH